MRYHETFPFTAAPSSAAATTPPTDVPSKYQRSETSGCAVVVPPDDAEPVVVELNVPA